MKLNFIKNIIWAYSHFYNIVFVLCFHLFWNPHVTILTVNNYLTTTAKVEVSPHYFSRIFLSDFSIDQRRALAILAVSQRQYHHIGSRPPSMSEEVFEEKLFLLVFQKDIRVLLWCMSINIVLHHVPISHAWL